MKVLATKSVRFSKVVDRCGRPTVYTLWQAPEKDRHLQAQLRQCRIMTIQEPAGGSAFGCVGLLERKGGIHLEFPKSLKRFQDQRIVGIKWDLVQE